MTGSPRPVLLRVHNASSDAVELSWVPDVGKDTRERNALVRYATLRPGQVHTQQTYAGHRWVVEWGRERSRPAPGWEIPATRAVLDAAKVDSTVVIHEDDVSVSHTLIPMRDLQGCRRRATIHGVIDVTAIDAVSDEAVAACVDCVTSIMDDMPEREAVLSAMARVGVEIAIIGVQQKTTDIPAHAHLKGQSVCVGPARSFDDGTRGLGATVACPVMSVGEENILPETYRDVRYPDESILVHEFAHTVMNIGLRDTQLYLDIKDAYCVAKRNQLYDPQSYCMENEDEYWAEMSQAWFGATRRKDVTSGVTTRLQVMERDPRLAAVMLRVWGNSPGRWQWAAPGGENPRIESRCCTLM